MTDASSREQERYHARELKRLRDERRAGAAAKLDGEPGEATKRRAFTKQERNAIAGRQSGFCAKCCERLTDPFHIDHSIPLELGGGHNWLNWEALCVPCHKIKTCSDIARIAKAKRQSKLLKPREKSKRPIRSRGFP